MAPSGWWQAPRPWTWPGPPVDSLQVVVGRGADREPPGRVRDRREAEHAGTALRGALASHERHDLRGRTNSAGVGPCERYDTASEAEPARRPVGGVERPVPDLVERRPATEVAADENGARAIGPVPASAAISPIVMPYSISRTPGRGTAPLTVASAVPGVRPGPRSGTTRRRAGR